LNIQNILDVQKILSHELVFYDVQPPSLIGFDEQFISGARLDNLVSCFVICEALCDSEDDGTSLIVCNDHEEVGSTSSVGAHGPFLRSVLERLAGNSSSEEFSKLMHRSLMLSVDNAHGVHPNFVNRHDKNHGPILNKGPVVKLNANQRYATNSYSHAVFSSLCDRVGVPYQSFSMRSDMGCGSTIGPITSTELGVKTVDVGVATFGMHSIRELAGSSDIFLMAKVITEFFSSREWL
jgi:aspartyl aminopeptidase